MFGTIEYKIGGRHFGWNFYLDIRDPFMIYIVVPFPFEEEESANFKGSIFFIFDFF